MEAVKYAREAIGLAINIEESQNKLHASGVQTSGIYSVDGALNQKQATDLMQWIETRIGGSNRHKPLVVDRGAKFTPISMSGADAQTIENRRFQIEEICRAFRVMPIMIGQADKAATYASAEQMFLAHVIHTLMPWYTRIEQSINMNLLTDQDISSGYYAKFNANALMRGAAKDRAEFYDKMYRMKAFSPNQILALEDMNPYDGGDEYYIEPGSQLLNDNKTSE
jgi:HK97 family phage portal protein